MLQVTLQVFVFFVVALTALILSRDAALVSCAFYFRYKSLPSPVRSVDCDEYRKMNFNHMCTSSSHKFAYCCYRVASVLVLRLEALFLLFVLYIVLLKGIKPFMLRPCKLLPPLKAYSL